MKKVKLIDLVGKDIAGTIANVTRQGGSYHYDYQDGDMVRVLKKVYFKTERGVKWLYWTWEARPEENFKHGYRDCGYSGVADSELHRLNEAYIYIE